jgi:hypothetical protein
MKCNFVVGQRVVCIDDNWPENRLFGVIFPPRVPMLNEVLTITNINPSQFGTDAVYLQFAEIPVMQSSQHVTAAVGYTHTHFAPLIERKTDISVFTAMLTPAGRIPVDA